MSSTTTAGPSARRLSLRVPPTSHVLALVCACTLFASGCHLDRRPLFGSMGDVTPREYCPGDTLRASFDLLQGETCPGDVDCAAFSPNLVLSATPADFPNTSFRAYTGGVDFSPSGDSVSVLFDIDRGSVTIPTDRFDDSGNRIFVVREPLSDQTVVARRMTDFDQELVHDGVCMGSTPTNVAAMLPGGPRISPQTRLQSLCNRSGVPIRVTLSGGAPGSEYTRELGVGDCLSPDEPGAPAGTDRATTVEAVRMIPDPGARCSATGPNNPPGPLRTVARLGCG